MKKKAFILCRTSREDGNDRTSTDAQEEVLTSLAERSGIELLEVYVDKNISGSVLPMDRPEAGKAFMRLAEIDYLMVLDQSRLMRSDHVEAAMIMSILKEANVKVMTADGGVINTDSPENKLIFDMMTSVNRFSRSKAIATSKLSIQKQLNDGTYIQSKPPAMYLKEDGKIFPKDEHTVKQLVNDALTMSMGKLCEKYDIKHTSLNKLLRTPILYGSIRYGDKTYKSNIVTPVITEEEFEILQTAVEGRSSIARGSKRHPTHLASGVIKCSCGGRLGYIRNKSGTGSYVCNSRTVIKKYCGAVRLPASQVEGLMYQILLVVLPSLRRNADKRNTDKKAEKRKSKLELHIKTLVKKVSTDPSMYDLFADEIKRLKDELDTLKQSLIKAKHDTIVNDSGLAKLVEFETMPSTEQNATVKSYVQGFLWADNTLSLDVCGERVGFLAKTVGYNKVDIVMYGPEDLSD